MKNYCVYILYDHEFCAIVMCLHKYTHITKISVCVLGLCIGIILGESPSCSYNRLLSSLAVQLATALD